LRSAYRAATDGADPSGVSVFRTHEIRLDRVPSRPRGQRCPRDRCASPAAACRFSTARPCHPGPQPAPGCPIHGASAKVHCRSPQPAFPSPVAPGGTGPSGFSLSSAPGRAGPCHARQGGDGLWALPGLRPWHRASLLRRTHSLRATTRRKARSGHEAARRSLDDQFPARDMPRWTWDFRGGAGDENRTRSISLGI
jgi:hypothetical protein